MLLSLLYVRCVTVFAAGSGSAEAGSQPADRLVSRAVVVSGDHVAQLRRLHPVARQPASDRGSRQRTD